MGVEGDKLKKLLLFLDVKMKIQVARLQIESSSSNGGMSSRRGHMTKTPKNR